MDGVRWVFGEKSDSIVDLEARLVIVVEEYDEQISAIDPREKDENEQKQSSFGHRISKEEDEDEEQIFYCIAMYSAEGFADGGNGIVLNFYNSKEEARQALSSLAEKLQATKI